MSEFPTLPDRLQVALRMVGLQDEGRLTLGLKYYVESV